MTRRSWTLGHVVVAVEVACGLFLAGYFTHLGVTAETEGSTGRTVFDRVLPFAVAVAALLATALLGPRRWRRAASPPPPRRPRPLTTRAGALPAEPAGRPALSDEGRRDLERTVAVLAGAGLFAPRVPDPSELVEAVADAQEPVTVDTVLGALWEADFHHAGFRPGDHLDALAHLSWKGEQLEETLRADVADLARLVGDDLPIELDDVRLDDEGSTVRTRLTLVLDGHRELLDYRGAPKWSSTVVHVAVARALTRTPARLAWFTSEQGAWVAVLRGGVTVEGLNAELGITGPDRWEWVDEQEPLVAGDL